MPATGVRPPARTLVTVRAIVPVAGMPPNSGLTMLATPCAISSWFGSWRGMSPAALSAMRAQSSDSIAPSSAIVIVGISNCLALSHENGGSAKSGNVRGMAPKREPMVSTGSVKYQHSSVMVTSATTGAGTRDSADSERPSTGLPVTAPRANSFGHSHSSTNEAPPIATACQFTLPRCSHSAPICEKKSAGILSIFRPSRSFNCDSAISTAMPLVKPMMIATGM